MSFSFSLSSFEIKKMIFGEKSIAKNTKRHQICAVRITIDIDEEVLKNAMRLTGERKKGPAIAKATREFVRRQMAREFGRMAMEGAFDYPLTNDELEALEVDACREAKQAS